MKQIMYEDCNNNSQFIRKIFYHIGLMFSNKLIWNISNLDMIPLDTEDYSGVGETANSSREIVYRFQQRIIDEHTIQIEHDELISLFDSMRTIYEGIFIVVLSGHQNIISIFDGDIIKIEGEIEKVYSNQK